MKIEYDFGKQVCSPVATPLIPNAALFVLL